VTDLPQPLRAHAAKVVVLLEDGGQVAGWLEDAGYDVVVARSAEEARRMVGDRLDLEVVVADAQRGLTEGVLAAAEGSPTGLEVVLVGPEDIALVPLAMAQGAASYLSHPPQQADILQHVLQAVGLARRALAAEEFSLRLPERVDFEGIVGSTPAMQRVMETLRRAAPTDAPIVILGETGTGKELFANAIHRSSTRRGGPFVALHLHATPEGLIESELFGHKKGAFTGAHGDRVGKLELADGGTLFLDELGDIPLETQTKLLRVLETRSFEPVGSNRSVTSDFRLVAATNQDIEDMIAAKKFREELWYRINVIRVSLPPLRERRSDIPLLVEHFVRDAASRYGKPIEGVDADAMSILQRQPWKGNIRELRNVVQNCVVMATGRRVTVHDLPPHLTGDAGGEAESPANASLAGRSMEEIEREAIRATLELTAGNRKKAADLLQIGERTLYRKIEKFGL